MERQRECLEPFTHRIEEATCIVLMLEAGYQIIRRHRALCQPNCSLTRWIWKESIPWPHRPIPPHGQPERRESRLQNRQNTICKETAAGQPKTGKYDYFTANIHATRPMAWQFFPDDYIALPKAAVAVSL
jgi:hypothetical protein